MSFKRVDDGEDTKFEGYSFVDGAGALFTVSNPEESSGRKIVDICKDNDWLFDLYIEDIPMFVKMLQAAYEHKQ